MAAYFQLTRIGSREPATFASIDSAICQNLNLPWDEDAYVNDWYDSIGFRLALGWSYAKIVDDYHKRHQAQPIIKGDDGDSVDPRWFAYYITQLRIVHFLCENYTTDAWMGR